MIESLTTTNQTFPGFMDRASVVQPVPFERLLSITLGLLVPLQQLRLGGLNFTTFDLAVTAVFSLYAVMNVLATLPLVYILGVIVMLFFGTLSALVANFPNLALPTLLQWYFAFIVVVPTIYTSVVRGNLTYLLTGLLFSGVLVSLYSVFSFLVGAESFIGGRYAGFMGDPQATAFVVCVFLPFFYLGVFQAPRNDTTFLYSMISRVACGMVTLLFVWVLFRTASRTGLTALSLGVLSCFLYQRFVYGRGGGNLVIAIVVLCIILVSVDVASLYRIAEDIDSPLSKLVQRILLTLQGDTGVSGRLELFENALFGLDLRTLLLGVGFENFALTSDYNKKPHNLFLVTLVEAGIACLIGLFIVLASVVFKQKRGLVDSESVYGLMVVAAMVSTIVIFMLNTQGINRVYWFVFALALYCIKPIKSEARA